MLACPNISCTRAPYLASKAICHNGTLKPPRSLLFLNNAASMGYTCETTPTSYDCPGDCTRSEAEPYCSKGSDTTPCQATPFKARPDVESCTPSAALKHTLVNEWEILWRDKDTSNNNLKVLRPTSKNQHRLHCLLNHIIALRTRMVSHLFTGGLCCPVSQSGLGGMASGNGVVRCFLIWQYTPCNVAVMTVHEVAEQDLRRGAQY